VRSLRLCGLIVWDCYNISHVCVLKIYNCSKLVSLVAKEGEEQLHLGWPSKLKEIKIINCKVLESLSKAMMHNNTCVEYIDISNYSSLTYFAIGQLPPTLKWATYRRL
jgi:hypothetical protein